MENKNLDLPNFLIVGAPKAGTTSLYYYLKQHPQINFGKIKEPFFLSFAGENFQDPKHITPSIITQFDDYKKLFENSKKYKAIGEASTFYLYFYKKTIDNIKKYFKNPEKIKIIIVLRDPTDRAFSHYKFNKRNFKENLSFSDAIKIERQRIDDNNHFTYHYVNVGYYYEQVKAYMDNFEYVKILLFEDLIYSTHETVKNLYNFLDVDKNFSPKINKIYNISGSPKSKLLHKLTFGDYKLKKFLEKKLSKKIRVELTRISSKINLKKVEIKEETKFYLKNKFEKNILKLEQLINKDLTHWKN